jgi:uncharacterized protein
MEGTRKPSWRGRSTRSRRGDELDLTDAVREHVVLETPALALCREDCRGLCPSCGADLNEGPCDCAPQAAPTAWDALKNVKFD